MPDNQIKWSYYQISEARKAVQTYYADQQSQQGARLVGFVIGLFTLLQLAQASKNLRLSGVFPNFPKVIEAINAPFWDFLKVLFLLAGTTIIMFFIFRTIFRYSLYGVMASQVFIVKESEIEKYKQDSDYNELHAFNQVVAVDAYKNKKVFWLPARWFMSLDDKECPICERTGSTILAGASFLLSIILLIFLW